MTCIKPPVPHYKSIASFEAERAEIAGTRSGVASIDAVYTPEQMEKILDVFKAREAAADAARFAARAQYQNMPSPITTSLKDRSDEQ
jgi:hypothetical protein